MSPKTKQEKMTSADNLTFPNATFLENKTHLIGFVMNDSPLIVEVDWFRHGMIMDFKFEFDNNGESPFLYQK